MSNNVRNKSLKYVSKRMLKYRQAKKLKKIKIIFYSNIQKVEYKVVHKLYAIENHSQLLRYVIL